MRFQRSVEVPLRRDAQRAVAVAEQVGRKLMGCELLLW